MIIRIVSSFIVGSAILLLLPNSLGAINIVPKSIAAGLTRVVNDSSITVQNSPGIIEEEDELILDDEEEFIIQEKPQLEKKVGPSEAVIVDSIKSKSPATITDAKTDSNNIITDTPSVATPEIVEVKPAVIEDIRSINFARNLKEYRSPRIAMALSMLLPGLGQAYAKNYWKSALFGSIEVTFIGVSVYLNSKGNSQKKKAHQFADKNFNFQKQLSYIDALQEKYDTFPEFSDIKGFIVARKEIERDASKKSDSYYSYLADELYVQGWDDCEPNYEDILNGRTITGSHGSYTIDDSVSYLVTRTDGAVEQKQIYGYSVDQLEYKKLKRTSDNTFNQSTSVLIWMLVNHVASAIDAVITAKAYNDKLLAKETVWDNLSIEHYTAFTGSAMGNGVAVKVLF